RTPQQNGVAERRNRTLIEAVRTMLADAKLPITFWAKAVNTACYVQNRVLVNKSQNKTPYKLFNGTNSTNFSGTKEAAGQDVKKDVSSLRSIVLPIWFHEAHLESSTNTSSGNSIPTISSPVPTAYLSDSPEPSSDTRLISKRVTSQDDTASLDNILSLTNMFEDILGVTTNTDDTNGVEANLGNMETTITSSHTPTLRIHKDHPKSQIIGHVDTLIQTRNKSKEMEEQSFIATIHQNTNPALLQFCLFSCFLSQEEPKKISDALQDPSWVEAMQEELL
nr:retrovirus-related Pol polyprotein from transposon TNT 1-94 [Tanacetum cinerariifolium]